MTPFLLTKAELEFWQTVIGHLAWPIAVLALAFAFRGSVREFLARLSALEAFGVKASADKAAERLAIQAAATSGAAEVAAEAAADAEVPASTPEDSEDTGKAHTPDAPSGLGFPSQIAESAYRNYLRWTAGDIDDLGREVSTVAWQKVQAAIYKAAQKSNLSGGSSIALAQILAARRIISNDVYELIRKANDLRNAVRHGAPISNEAAFAYLSTCDRIVDLLSAAGTDA